MPIWKRIFWNLTVAAFLPIFFIFAVIPTGVRRRYIWGSTPLISNKYWSAAMRKAGYDSLTFMAGHYSINAAKDFDRYFDDMAPRFLPRPLRFALGACLSFIAILRTARVVHISFDGFALGQTIFWRLEAPLLHLARVKIVAMPYGGDFYAYNQLIDTSLRYGLLASYPQLARRESRVASGVRYWCRHADALIAGMMVDGLGRWDVTLSQFFTIDTDMWPTKERYSPHDGRSGPVRVLHTPNHRGFKGTEFLVAAVDALRKEGLDIDLVLLERVPNETVRQTMAEIDILAEQFIATGYAFSGIEGMASGLTVMANLEHEAYTRVFRRYSFLNECPILSTSPETLVDNLRALVTRPDLREALGRASRAYAEKYHSCAMAQYMFGAVYDRILHDKDVDLINLFHPLKSSYCRATPRVAHPLVESRLANDERRADVSKIR